MNPPNIQHWMWVDGKEFRHKLGYRFAVARVRIADGCRRRIANACMQAVLGHEKAWLIGERRATGE